MATIYLSSTYEDLKDHRLVVHEALRKAGHQVIAMEDYVATDQRPVEKCLKDVEKADIYIGLFAFRYGYIPPAQHNNPNGLSITELEYRRAESCKNPCLTFVVNDSTAWPRVFDDARSGADKGERINALRQYLLTEKLASQFASPHELSTLVLAAVSKHLAENTQPESVQAGESASPPSTTWNIETQGSPYPGLFHFSRPYAPVFFGRDREVREILDLLRGSEGRFLLLSGASGSGKSSLVDAGVLPRIEKYGIAGARTYRCVRMVPSKGNNPFDALLRPLHVYAERAGMDTYQVAEQLVSEPWNLSQRIQDIVAKGLDREGLVLFLDQMEELFTLRDLAQAQAFLSALYQAAQDASLSVIATIRSDFLQHCHEHEDMLKVLKGHGHYPLGPIDSISLGEMIAMPARSAGLAISQRLVRRLIAEAGQERGSLPLLAFALHQLFNKRVSDELTESTFDQLGGLAGAIRSHVITVEDKIVGSLPTDEGEIFSKLFAPLLVVTIDRTATRRWVSRESVDPTLHSAIDILIQERLLAADEGLDHKSLIAVSHEKLFEGWPRLAKWIEINREDLFILRQAEVEAGEWERQRYDLKYLWHADRLKHLQEIVTRQGEKSVKGIVRFFMAPWKLFCEHLEDPSLSHAERFMMGQSLEKIGDLRPGIGLKEDGLPDIMWIDIPGGNIKLERINHVFEVPPFRIAKYPVTNAQFEGFLKAEDGYRNYEWWRDIEQSRTPGRPSWREPNCPRENVSWYEAVAFCRWLSAKTETSIRLPTEWEWQQAATGGDIQREYPWGGEWDSDRCNSYRYGPVRTTVVGIYPQGATQQGVLDMTGNIWEWCLNEYNNPDHKEATRIEGKLSERVIRGGSWSNDSSDREKCLRVSYRYGYTSVYRFGALGFRLVQDIP